ncbi:MAG: arginine biosynthesis bifunctional protein ArgJ [Nitrospirales bacterium]|nr:MAG: arginine biosynthesis bifunctional protein ArgJ [Nitrospirales bacterium]
MKRTNGGITAPKGFMASGIHAGIKASPLLDLALLVSDVEGPIAGVFTKNQIPAAPVILDRLHLKKQYGRAIIINSGNANACTGAHGLKDAEEMAKLVAIRLDISTTSVFVGSTGVIGPRLPMPAIRKGIPSLMQRLRKSGHRDAARAIMTTDTTVKELAIQTRIGKQLVTIGGMAKGSGMIHPDMATMLAYVTTDATIQPKILQVSLREAVHSSFNTISVDGETSTNDTVLCLANGMANNTMIPWHSADHKKFQHALNDVCQALAMKICQDGEGATKIVEILVHGAKTDQDAKVISKTLATSPLVKTALFGEDPNWGRFMVAIGRAGPAIQPKHVEISFDDVTMVKNGQEIIPSRERQVQRVMKKKSYAITVTVGRGKSSAKVWTTDFSYDYVKINASYRS